jgi:YVTN family beta-propeller protein
MFLKKNFFLFFISVILFNLSSCKEDPVDPPTELPTYEDGIFVTNEGPFQNGSGSLSFYSRKTGEISNDIFQNANNGVQLGNIVQSMTIHNDLAYIVVNNANKIVIAKATTFEKVGEITDLELPRYFLPVSEDKAFVSQWGADGVTGSIKVIDLMTNTVSNTIETRPGPESMLLVDDFVYVTNSGGFALDSVVSKIDVATETVIKTIEVGLYPSHIVEDANQELWVLTSGYYDWMNIANNRDGNLVKLNNDDVVLSMVAKQGSSSLTINSTLDKLYFNMELQVFEHPINETSISNTSLISRSFYGLGIDPETDDIFGLDPKSWDQDGDLYIFNESGIATDSMKVGLGPGGLWFD